MFLNVNVLSYLIHHFVERRGAERIEDFRLKKHGSADTEENACICPRFQVAFGNVVTEINPGFDT